MIPLERLPGAEQWAANLEALLVRPEPIWVQGARGCGVSTLGSELARRREVVFLDDADLLGPAALDLWLQANPRGVLASHGEVHAEVEARCLVLKMPTLAEAPASVPGCLAALAAEEGCSGVLPGALGLLPCPGNLRGLRNRLLRWKLLGQLPEKEPLVSGEASLPLVAEDLATNLHVLERLLLHRVLRRSYGNRVEAARRLGVSRRQLYLLIARHGDPVRGEPPTSEGPKRLGKARMRQNSSPERLDR